MKELGDRSITVNFLRAQQAYFQKAKDMTVMMTPDKNGWLPLHHAIEDRAPLGSIKLLVKGNPSAVRVISNTGKLPLHIACEFSSVKVVRYLVEERDGIPMMSHFDTNKDSIMHYACRGGNLGVVKYLITNHASLVASVEVNRKDELPFHLLCEAGKDRVDCDSTEYTETIWLMLLSNPEVIMS